MIRAHLLSSLITAEGPSWPQVHKSAAPRRALKLLRSEKKVATLNQTPRQAMGNGDLELIPNKGSSCSENIAPTRQQGCGFKRGLFEGLISITSA